VRGGAVSASGLIGDNPDMDKPRLVLCDDGSGDLGPLTDCRAACDVRSGTRTGRERVEAVLGRPAGALRVPRAIEALERGRAAGVAVNQALPRTANPDVLVVSARWHATAGAAHVRALRRGERLVQGDGQWVAALLPVDQADALLAGAGPPAGGAATVRAQGRLLIDRPWHVLDDLEAALRVDLQSARGQARPAGASVFGDHALAIAPGVRVQPGVVFNLEQGPVVIEEGASVGALSVLEGPCFVGAHSVVQPQSLLRAQTAIGPHCKVAGEVAFSIIQGYANKAHAGFLGHSLVGAWVNLGAQTVVSNLKNTYGSVRVQLRPGAAAEDTGRTFQGPIIGDFVRTAIGTRIPTGACVQTGSMLAMSNFAPKVTPRFAFLTDGGAARCDLEKFLATARLMMARRQVRLEEAEEARLRELHAQVDGQDQ
jgi:UDP-N-acetylglucosamine diphosphorylase/glucosamine-1-phosphate N-acetyltransferase